jgi:hypothetical protein
MWWGPEIEVIVVTKEKGISLQIVQVRKLWRKV